MTNQNQLARYAREAFFNANVAILCSKPGNLPKWAIRSKPYLKAIIDNDYGLEDPKMVVLYALNNMHGWKGDTARKVKAHLNALIQ